MFPTDLAAGTRQIVSLGLPAKADMTRGMNNNRTIAMASLILIIGLGSAACVRRDVVLPHDLLGISVGMNKADALKRLEEIGTMESEGRKVGQLWRLKNDPQFSALALDYDNEDRVRFVTAFVEKTTAKEKIRFADVGDLTKAKAEITEPHYRYIWEVAAENDKPTYFVIVYGDSPEYVTIYSLSKKPDPVVPEAVNTNQENS